MSYTEESYSAFVARSVSPSESSQQITREVCSYSLALNTVELAAMVTTAEKDGSKIDMQALVKKLGEVEFCLQAIRDQYELTRAQVIKANVIEISNKGTGV